MHAYHSKRSSLPGSAFPMLRRVVHLTVLAMVCLLISSVDQARSASLREYEIKAAFLYNFAKFVEWPSHAASEVFCIGILGHDPFGSNLESLTGKTIKGKPVVIRRFKRVQDLEFCHIVFISASEQGRLTSILESLADRHILTVSEVEQFTRLGGIINLTVRKNKTRFEVNSQAAKQAVLRISAKLLRLAAVVQ